MTGARIPVPPGFVVAVTGYSRFLEETRLIDKIRTLLDPLDQNNSVRLQEVFPEIKEAIISSKMPPRVAEAIKPAYGKLGRELVAVRSWQTSSMSAMRQ